MNKPQFKVWINERLPFIGPIDSMLRLKTVPRHRYSFLYLLGGLCLFLFGVQVITGLLLSLYYTPTPEGANESVRRIIFEVHSGWIVRSVHVWGANFMVGAVLLHMFSTYFMKAYRKPREFMWLSGSVILFLILGFAFTGYLLPWDTTAYFATQIGTEIPKSLPLIGDIVVTLLRGGNDVGPEALKRMYIFHIAILPLITVSVILFHVLLQQVLGTSEPIGVTSLRPAYPFFPNFLYRDLIAWVSVLMLVVGLATLVPQGLGEKVDPYASAPAGIRPEWYFLPLYQTLRIFPATVFSLSGEMVVNIGVGIIAILWMAVPFLDRKGNEGRNDRLFVTVGIILFVYYGLTIALGLLT